LADLTGNGSADIVWRNQQNCQNWLYAMRQSTIENSAAINRVSDLNWQIAQAADFDGDGRADLLWRNATTGANAVYLMQGHQIELIQGINSVPVEWRVVR
tara:strand:- start:1200 stop:1499 length:300 start_codon:yes stop_codon:yes gene_type:complete